MTETEVIARTIDENETLVVYYQKRTPRPGDLAMRSVRLLVFLTLFAAPLALVPLATTPTEQAEPKALPELAGRWRVESATVDGRQTLRPAFEEVVFTAKTAEYVSPTPVVAPSLSAS